MNENKSRSGVDELLTRMAEETPEMPASFHADWMKAVKAEMAAAAPAEETPAARRTRFGAGQIRRMGAVAAAALFLIGGTLLSRDSLRDPVTAPEAGGGMIPEYRTEKAGVLPADALQADLTAEYRAEAPAPAEFAEEEAANEADLTADAAVSGPAEEALDAAVSGEAETVSEEDTAAMNGTAAAAVSAEANGSEADGGIRAGVPAAAESGTGFLQDLWTFTRRMWPLAAGIVLIWYGTEMLIRRKKKREGQPAGMTGGNRLRAKNETRGE